MQTRGWTFDSYTLDSTTGDDVYTYRVSKNVSTREGTNVQHGFAFVYIVYATSLTDRMEVYQWNPDDPDTQMHAHADFSNSSSGSSTSGLTVKGKWGFWTSDEDSDSFFLMAESRANSPIIGFWPPAGSLFTNGTSNAAWNSAVVFSPFTNRYLFHSVYAGGDDMLKHPFTGLGNANSDLDNMDSTQIKTDFAWFLADSGRPVFATIGSDIQIKFEMNNSTAANPTIWQDAIYSREAAVITEIGGRYYVSSGDHSKILFDCGTSAPPAI